MSEEQDVLWGDETPQMQALKLLSSLRDQTRADMVRLEEAIRRGGSPREMRNLLDAWQVMEAQYTGLKRAMRQAQEQMKRDGDD